MSRLAGKQRYLEMLKTAFGPDILKYLDGKQVIEVMRNPDGRVFVEDLRRGKYLTDTVLPSDQAENIIKLVAAFKNDIADSEHPMVSAELPIHGARFQGWLPPVVAEPTFAIRKRALQIFTLEHYRDAEVLSREGYKILKDAMHTRQNIMIVGGTGSGKTTFANALLATLRGAQDRVLVLEDLRELQLDMEDVVFMESTPSVSMRDLVKGALRMRPDRIVVGEVRDGAALDMLKAWNTGHPGGICTIHANSVESAPYRLEDLIQEVAVTVPRNLILQAVNLFVFLEKTPEGHRGIADIARLDGYLDGRYLLTSLLEK